MREDGDRGRTDLSSNGSVRQPQREIYRVGMATLDVGARRITVDDEPIDLTPHAFDLLLTLVRRAPDACSTEELMAAVWPDTYVGEENVKQQVMLLRKALGDDAAEPRYVETVRGFGYRLVHEVESGRAVVDDKRTPGAIRRPRSTYVLRLAALVAIPLLLVFGAVRLGRLNERSNPPPSRTTSLVTDRIFVEVFDNHTGDPAYDALALQLSDRIAAGLATSRRIEVVSAASAVLSSTQSTRPALERARANHAAWLLNGAIETASGGTRISANLIEVEGGAIRAPLAPMQASAEDPADGVGALVDLALAAVAAEMDPSLASLGAGASRPISLSAYEEYAKGIRQTKKMHPAQALTHFEAAGEHDPRFHQARLMSMLSLINLGRFEEARDLGLTIPEAELPPMDRAFLLYNQTLMTGDRGAHLEHARVLAEAAPASPFAFGAGAAALLANRPQEAVDRLRALDPAPAGMANWIPLWYYQTLAHHALGQAQAEFEVAEDARVRFAGARAPAVMLARAWAVAGEEAHIVDLLHEVAATPPEPAIATRTVAWVAASELAAHGRAAVAARVAATGLALRAEPETDPVESRDRARLLVLLGRSDEALSLLQGAVDRHPRRLDLLGELGLAAVASAETAAVEEALTLLGQRHAEHQGAALFWRAAIRSLRGDPDAALDLLQQAVAAGFPVWLTPDLLDTSLQLHAHPAFQSLMEDRRLQALLWPEGVPEGWRRLPIVEDHAPLP